MNRKKKIFESSTPLSKEELKAYLNEDLPKADKYKLEQKIAANEFHSDAVEGFENVPGALAGFSELDNKFHGNLPRKFSKSFWRFEYSILLIVGMAIGMFLVGSYFLNQASLNKEEFDKNVLESSILAKKEANVEIIVAPIVDLNDTEIEAAIPLKKERQLTSEKIIIEAPVTLVADSSTNQVNNIDSVLNAIVIRKEKVNLYLVEKKEIPPIDKSIIVYSNVKTLFLSQLLVVDYSEIYTEEISVPDFELTGTAANLENKQDLGNEDMNTTSFKKEIPYLDFLEEVQSDFRKNHFKSALKGYKTVLNQYSDDVNAHFYMALCYFNINKQKKAIQHFERVIKHEYNTFHEEATWYKAISLYEMGEISQCITVLNQIANANGFYAEKASNMLNDI